MSRRLIDRGSHRHLWTFATLEELPMRCQPLKTQFIRFLENPVSYTKGTLQDPFHFTQASRRHATLAGHEMQWREGDGGYLKTQGNNYLYLYLSISIYKIAVGVQNEMPSLRR